MSQRDSIIAEYLAIFSIEPLVVKRVPRGSAILFYINASDRNKYVLKLYESKHSFETIERDHLIASHLRNNGIPAPVYISANNQTIFGQKGAYYSLMEYIPGRNIGDNCATQSQLLSSAFMYAKIINALKCCPISFPSFDFSVFNLSHIESVEDRCNCLLSIGEPDVQQLVRKKTSILKHVLQLIDVQEFFKMTFLNSHGDYTHFQLLYDNGGNICGVLDFLSAKKLPPVWELFRCFIYQEKSYNPADGSFSLKALVSFIKAYSSCSSLRKNDIFRMIPLYAYYAATSMFGIDLFINTHNAVALSLANTLLTQTCYIVDNYALIQRKLEEYFCDYE